MEKEDGRGATGRGAGDGGRPRSPRKPYTKPLLEQVQLRPEEAVLGNCKIAGTAGPAASSCSSLGCSSLGS